MGWLRALGDERGHGVLRSVAMGYLSEPDSLGMLHDQVVRMRATTEQDVPQASEPQTTDDGEREKREPVEVPDTFQRLPTTTVYLHLDRASGTWSMDGVGPITRAEAAQLVGHSQVTLKPVIDLAENITTPATSQHPS